MRNLPYKLLVLLCTVFIVISCNETLVTEETENDSLELKSASIEKKSYIVVLNDADLDNELSTLKGYEKKQATVKAKTNKILKRAGITDGEIDFVYGTALKGFSLKIAPGQLKKLEDDPSVKYIEENQIISLNIPKVKVEGSISASADNYPWGIVRVNGGQDCTGKVAWVIDTGIDLDHPDLNVDASRGAYFVSRVSSPDDDNGHGSHCAGIIAAKSDGAGVIGVAANATVIPVKVLDKRGNGTVDGVLAGINYVAANASSGDVANMSLGGGVSTTLDNAVLTASEKCKFALAAGNESDDANNHSPARVNGTNIFTVSAMAEGDLWAYYSNYGNPPIEYCAPGSSIYSTYKSGGYATMSGTSMATPHVAGILLTGTYTTDGTVNGDPDGNPDEILVVDGDVTNDYGSLIGTVTDGTNGISGATVTIGDLSTNTASDGSYSISSIPEGTYTITASANGYTPETIDNVSIVKDVPTTQNFNLTEIVVVKYTVSGTVTKADGGLAIAGALVQIEGTSLSANSDVNGVYSIDNVEAGNYNITASADGFVSLTVNNFSVNSNVSGLNFNLETTPVSSITLEAEMRKVRGVRYVDMTWSGATGTEVIVKVNGSDFETIANDEEATLDMARSSGTFTFQICETDGSACSNIVTLAL